MYKKNKSFIIADQFIITEILESQTARYLLVVKLLYSYKLSVCPHICLPTCPDCPFVYLIRLGGNVIFLTPAHVF